MRDVAVPAPASAACGGTGVPRTDKGAGSVGVGEGVRGVSVSPQLLGAEGSSAGKRLLQPGPSAHRGALLWASSGPFE